LMSRTPSGKRPRRGQTKTYRHIGVCMLLLGGR
jgi:hypothetical protein